VKKILVADDDEDVRTVLGLPLEGRYRVVEATNGPEVMATAKRERPDLIIMDWNMPGMTGAELLRALRADEGLAPTPIIVLTGQTNQADIAESRALGAQNYLIKPVAVRHFLEAVRTALGETPNPA
jgi:two-component system phosphate regulon response regulator PhoB